MARAGLAVLTLALALAMAPLSQGQTPTEVVTLSSSDFEHHTQAATGQTTGRWCVLFVDSAAAGDAAQEAAADAWQQLAQDEDKDAIMAQVDVATSPELAQRFALAGSTPAVVLLRDRQMFRLEGPWEAEEEAVVQRVLDFLAGGWQEQEGAQVPPETAGLVALALTYLAQPGTQLLVFGVAGVALVATGLSFLVVVAVTANKAPPTTTPAEAKGEAKADATAAASAAGSGGSPQRPPRVRTAGAAATVEGEGEGEGSADKSGSPFAAAAVQRQPLAADSDDGGAK